MRSSKSSQISQKLTFTIPAEAIKYNLKFFTTFLFIFLVLLFYTNRIYLKSTSDKITQVIQ